MTSSASSIWYDYYLQQAAAESYFERVDLGVRAEVNRALTNGNNRPDYVNVPEPPGKTRLTDLQAQDFIVRFNILHQWSDNPLRDRDLLPNEPGYLELNGERLLANTGLSATLIQNRETGAYTLSIRSTEYVSPNLGGDKYRDLDGADKNDLAFNGFAFAQIDALEHYYAWLLENIPGLSEGPLYVTGYSLGGHLATVFTEMHPEVVQAYTFNGAGRGEWDHAKGDLADIVAYYRDILGDPRLASFRIASDAASALRAAALKREGEPLDAVDISVDARHAWAVYSTVERFGIQSLAAIAVATAAISDPNRTDLTNNTAARITQLYGQGAHHDVQLVANSGIHGPAQQIFIEDQPDVAGTLGFPERWGWGGFGSTHSITLLGDSLALMRLMNRLDATTSPETLGQVFAAASNEHAVGILFGDGFAEGDSLERIVMALGAAFQVELQAMDPLRTDGGFADFTQRTIFHENLQRIESAIDADVEYSIASLATMDPQVLLSSAREDGNSGLEIRYALSALNPFSIAGVDYPSLHDARGELDLWNAQTRQGELTSDWLGDRSAFLAWKNVANLADIVSPTTALSSSQRFIDKGSGRDLYVTGPDSALPAGSQPSVRRFVFGTTGPDSLFGGITGDRIYGGMGTDYLAGGAGNDRLEGGSGLDVYDYNASDWLFGGSSDGFDRILDTDGVGVLRYVNVLGFGAAPTVSVIRDATHAVDDHTWTSADGHFTYNRVSAEDGSITLEIAFEQGGGIVLEQFREGDFGIRLEPLRSLPAITETVLGDRATKDIDPDQPGVQEGRDAFNRVMTTKEAGPPRDDFLLGRWAEFDPATGAWGVSKPGAPGERIEGQAGDDLIVADPLSPLMLIAPPLEEEVFDGRRPLDNDDWISGGSGRDRIYAGGGDDFVFGGSGGVSDGDEGGDVVYGGDGDDDIFGDEYIDFDTALLVGDGATSADAKGDFLSGGAGADRIVGMNDRDVLLGGGGADLLIGGAGDDLLDGGAGYAAVNLEWNVMRSTDTNAGYEIHRVEFTGIELRDISADGADTIYGGRGADWAFGGAGDDFIDTGADDDVAYGGGGADTLLGGSGDDVLVGDRSEGQMPGDAAGDYLDGGDGSDRLYGDAGDDVLVGGRGNDFLLGGAGRDVYLFDKGDGEDWIIDTPETGSDPEASILLLGAGFTRADVTFRLGSLLIDLGLADATDPASADRVHVDGFDPDNPFSTPVLAEIRFTDGEVMTYADILARGFDILGTDGDDNGSDSASPALRGTVVTDRILGLAGNDVLAGLAGDDVLDGGGGDDTLEGGDGDDILIGGIGLDILRGGAGHDTYVVEGGDFIGDAEGGDDVELPASITTAGLGAVPGWFHGARVIELTAAGQVLFRLPQSSDVVSGLTLVQSDGSATALAGFLGAEFHERVFETGSFGDGQFVGFAEADHLRGGSGADHLSGFAGDDTLEGGSGNDTLVGGAGDDMLSGDAGDDEYLFRLGDGIDVIDEHGGGGIDTVRFAADTAPSAVTPRHMANGDLVVRYGDGAAVTVSGFFADPLQRIEGFVLGDGGEWSEADLLALPVVPIDGTSGDDVLVGTLADEVLEAGSGSDTLDGSGGNDVLRGGEGSDRYRLSWGTGHDRVEDDAGAVETIVLDAALSFADLSARVVGADIVISLGSADDLALMGEAGTIDRWRVTDGDGTIRTIAEVIESTSLRASQSLEASRLAYVTSVKSSWFNSWYDDGFRATGAAEFGSVPPLVGLSELVTNVHSTTYRMPENEVTGETVRTIGDGSVEGLTVERTLRKVDTIRIADDAGQIDVVAVPALAPAWFDATVALEIERQSEYAGSGPSFSTVFDPTPDVPDDAFFITATDQSFIRYSRSYRIGQGDVAIIRSNVETSFIVPLVDAGGSDNHIEYTGNAAIDAGAGDDVMVPMARLKEGQLTNFQYVPRARDVGAWLSGAAGNDWLVGTSANDFLAGGTGDDLLEGGAGSDRYLILAADEGVDRIVDPADRPDGESAGGLRRAFERWLESSGEARARSSAVYAVDDEQVIRSGVIERDVLQFGPGLDADRMSVALEPAAMEPDGEFVLSLAWNGVVKARVNTGYESDWQHMLPWDTGPASLLGSSAGIERFEFADGTVLSLTQLRRRALQQGSDIVLSRGDGDVSIDDADVPRRLRFGPDVFPQDLLVFRDGRDAVFALRDTNDSWRVAGWFGNDGATHVASLSFVDTGYWDIDALNAHLLNVSGSEADEVLAGVDGFPNSLAGLGGADTIVGSDRGDFLSGGDGNDSLSGDGKIAVPLTILARGSSALDVAARMEVRVDGVLMEVTDVLPTNGFSPYRFDVEWSRGVRHRVDVVFVNDSWVPELQQDRNLFVQSIEVGEARFMSTDSGVRYDRGVGSTASDGLDVLAGQVAMPWNGALRFELPTALFGAAGNDFLDGGQGDDWMEGDGGDDIYMVDSVFDQVIEQAGGGWDRIVASANFDLPPEVETLELIADAHEARGNLRDNVLIGGQGDDRLAGAGGFDFLLGGSGDDRLSGEGIALLDLVVRARGSMADGVNARMELRVDGTTTEFFDVDPSDFRDYEIKVAADVGRMHRIDVAFINDAYFPARGEDRNLFVESVSFAGAVLRSSDAGVEYDRGAGALAYDGFDVLQGQRAMPWSGALRFEFAEHGEFNDALDSGPDNDVLDGGGGNDFLAGGPGADLYRVEAGRDLIAFNRGDGADRIETVGGGLAGISLGGGIRLRDLHFERNGDDLILETGKSDDRLTFAEWFAGPAPAESTSLQFVGTTTSADGSTEVTLERYDFATVIAEVHAAEDAASGNAEQWAAAFAAVHALGEDDSSEALGGDLAVHYGLNGTLAGLPYDTALATLRATDFATSPQLFRSTPSPLESTRLIG
ncbi:MAG: carbohydrate-binding domain-containing protein [Betaproteobacteria bacterium]